MSWNSIVSRLSLGTKRALACTEIETLKRHSDLHCEKHYLSRKLRWDAQMLSSRVHIETQAHTAWLVYGIYTVSGTLLSTRARRADVGKQQNCTIVHMNSATISPQNSHVIALFGTKGTKLCVLHHKRGPKFRTTSEKRGRFINTVTHDMPIFRPKFTPHNLPRLANFRQILVCFGPRHALIFDLHVPTQTATVTEFINDLPRGWCVCVWWVE